MDPTAKAAAQDRKPSPAYRTLFRALESVWPWCDCYARGRYRIQTHVNRGGFRLRDGNHTLAHCDSYTACRARLDAVMARHPEQLASEHLVVFVHGMGRWRGVFTTLAAALQKRGFATHNYLYPCPGQPLAAQTARFVRFLNNIDYATTVSFVTQSYGALVLREALATGGAALAHLSFGRAVLLVPPNRGSWAAEIAARMQLVEPIVGAGGWRLTPEEAQALPLLPLPFIIIAGGRGRDRGFLPVLAGDNDGLVRVAETHLEGAHGHTVLPLLHPFSTNHPTVVALVCRFLEDGRLAPPRDKAQA